MTDVEMKDAALEAVMEIAVLEAVIEMGGGSIEHHGSLGEWRQRLVTVRRVLEGKEDGSNLKLKPATVSL